MYKDQEEAPVRVALQSATPGMIRRGTEARKMLTVKAQLAPKLLKPGRTCAAGGRYGKAGGGRAAVVRERGALTSVFPPGAVRSHEEVQTQPWGRMQRWMEVSRSCKKLRGLSWMEHHADDGHPCVGKVWGGERAWTTGPSVSTG